VTPRGHELQIGMWMACAVACIAVTLFSLLNTSGSPILFVLILSPAAGVAAALWVDADAKVLLQKAPHELSSRRQMWRWIAGILHGGQSGPALRGQILSQVALLDSRWRAHRDEVEADAALLSATVRIATRQALVMARKYPTAQAFMLLADLALIETAALTGSESQVQDVAVRRDASEKGELLTAAQLSTAMEATYQARRRIVWYEFDLAALLALNTWRLRRALDAHHMHHLARGREVAAGGLDDGTNASSLYGSLAGSNALSSVGGPSLTSSGGGDKSGFGGGGKGREVSSTLTPSRMHQYENALQAAIEADLDAVRAVSSAWGLLAEGKVPLHSANKRAVLLKRSAQLANTKYVEAIRTIPDSVRARRQYAEFVQAVAGMTSEAQHMLQVAQRLAATSDRSSLGAIDTPLSSLQFMVPLQPLHDLAADVDGEVPSLLCSGVPGSNFTIRETGTSLSSLLGMSASELVGLELASLFPEPMRDAMLQALREAQNCFKNVHATAPVQANKQATEGRGGGVSALKVFLGQSQVWVLWNQAQQQLLPVLATVHLVHGNCPDTLPRAAEPLLKIFFARVQDRSALFLVTVPRSKALAASRAAEAKRQGGAGGSHGEAHTQVSVPAERVQMGLANAGGVALLACTSTSLNGPTGAAISAVCAADIFQPLGGGGDAGGNLRFKLGTVTSAAIQEAPHAGGCRTPASVFLKSLLVGDGVATREWAFMLVSQGGGQREHLPPRSSVAFNTSTVDTIQGTTDSSGQSRPISAQSSESYPPAPHSRHPGGTHTTAAQFNAAPAYRAVSNPNTGRAVRNESLVEPDMPYTQGGAGGGSASGQGQFESADESVSETLSRESNTTPPSGAVAVKAAPSALGAGNAVHVKLVPSETDEPAKGSTAAVQQRDSKADARAGIVAEPVRGGAGGVSPMPDPAAVANPHESALGRAAHRGASFGLPPTSPMPSGRTAEPKMGGSGGIAYAAANTGLRSELQPAVSKTFDGDSEHGRSGAVVPRRSASYGAGGGTGTSVRMGAGGQPRIESNLSSQNGSDSQLFGVQGGYESEASGQMFRHISDIMPMPADGAGGARGLDGRSMASTGGGITKVRQGRMLLQRQLLGIGKDNASQHALALWGVPHSGDGRTFKSAPISWTMLALAIIVPVLCCGVMLPTFLLFDPVLTNLSEMNRGLWIAGVRIQYAQWMEASIQRMLVRGLGLNIEPVALTLKELKVLESEFAVLIDDLQRIDFNTHSIMADAALEFGVDIDGPYTPPANVTPSVLDAQFQKDIDSNTYWSDRQRWVPIADDAVSAERILSLFEVSQWIQTNMRSVIDLKQPEFFGAATDPSVTALFGSGMMPRRVWPAYNRSVQARIQTLKHYSDSSTGDTSAVTTIAAAVLAGVITVVAVLMSYSITRSLHAPLRFGASLRESVTKNIQVRLAPRMSELAGLGKSTASATLDFGVDMGGAGGGGAGGSDDDGASRDSIDSEKQPLIRIPVDGVDYQGGATDPASFEAPATPLQGSKGPTHVPSLRALDSRANPIATTNTLVVQFDDSGRKAGTPAVRVNTNSSEATGRRRRKSGNSPSLARKWREAPSKWASLPVNAMHCCCILLGPLISIVFAAAVTTLLVEEALPSVFHGVARTIWMLELSFHQYNQRDALGNLALGAPNQADAIRDQGSLMMQRISDVLQGAPTGPMGGAVPALPVDAELHQLLLEDGCVPHAPWQINCTTAYNGVAKNGGLVQPLLRIVSLGETIIRLERDANLAPGQALLFVVPAAQQIAFDVISIERFLTRDTVSAALKLILSEVTDEVARYRDLMYISSYGNLAFLLVCVALTVLFFHHMHEWVLASRLLLLYVPEREVTGPAGARVNKQYGDILQLHISEST